MWWHAMIIPLRILIPSISVNQYLRHNLGYKQKIQAIRQAIQAILVLPTF